jgi:hypothetical protein
MKQTNDALYLGIGAAILLLVGSQSQATPDEPTPVVELTPVAPEGGADAHGLAGLQGSGNAPYAPSGWYDASSYVRILIPFQSRSVRTGGNSYGTQFLYNGQWYDMQRLFRVWNPIRALPSWMR